MTPSTSATKIYNSQMEQSHSLILNEEALHQCPDPQKAIFFYEWLRYLERILPLTKKSDLKHSQEKLLEQLTARITIGCAQPTRELLGRCIARLFAIADASHLFQTINICNDALKNPTMNNQVKLTALCILGEMYQSLGRMVGRSYEETFQALSKWMKSAESSLRVEILKTMAKMVKGLGAGIFPLYKDIYKCITKSLNDRIMSVRVAAAKCMVNVIAVPDSPLFSQHDLESICTLCIKSLHSSDFEVRQAIAQVFGKLAVQANTAQLHHREGTPAAKQSQSNTSNKSIPSLDELLQYLANAMLKGGVGGFLKTAKSATGIQTGGQRETRVGIAEAYVCAARELGQHWLKQNIHLWCRHLLDLASKCSTLPNNNPESSDLLLVRRCIHFIFRSTIGIQLSEPDQISASKHLGAALAEYINCFDCAMDSSKEEERILGAEAHASAQACIACLLEIGCIAYQVDTAMTSIFIEASGILEPIFSCFLHPIQSVRVAAAWCLRHVVLAIPSLATPLVDRCLNRLEYMKKSPEAISGFSLALTAILTQSRHSQLGIPFSKCRQIFTVAEDLIKSATQTPRLMLRKWQAGWLMMSAVISIGSSFTKSNLSRLFTLWRISFPRSAEETKTERGRGDVNSWEATLEARAGALASMGTLIRFCPDLINDELSMKFIVPIETSLITMDMVAYLLLIHGARIRPAIQLLHLRLFTLLYRLPISRFESVVNPLLKELVAEITLSDNAHSTQRTSLSAGCCSTLENTFLDGWIRSTEQSYLETQLNPLQTILHGSLDFDQLQLVEYDIKYNECVSKKWWWPEAEPISIAALDSSIQLFSRVFPIVSTRCKIQIIQHFMEQLRTVKINSRLQALQLNILTAFCMAAKNIGERRSAGRMDDEQLQQESINLITPFMASEFVLLKCLAVETLGRLTQAVGTPQFVASNAQFCFDKIRLLKDEWSRQGFALALGILHRYTGSLGSGQHLNTTIGILLALAQDINCTSIKPWAIFSLSLIASTGGGMFCPYAEPVRNLCLQLLLNITKLQIDVVRAIAKLIFSLISAIGPELNTTVQSIQFIRNVFLTASSMLVNFDDFLIKADAISCYQYLHLFAPRFVDLNELVLIICDYLNHPCIILRKSAIACLRQLLQQEAKEVREYIKPLIPSGLIEERALEKKTCIYISKNAKRLPETGLEGALFEMLDTETDAELRQHIKQSLLFLAQATSDELLGFWLLLCKDILASSQLNHENLRSTLCINMDGIKQTDQQDTTSTNDDDILQYDSLDRRNRDKLHPRWSSRVFAFDIVQRLLLLCETERAHLDLALAKELQMTNSECSFNANANYADYLVLHLSDLVRMAFIGATSENNNLRIAGLNCLQDIITRFAKVAEPEFPGHMLLEQFQAQIGAALRPAFAPETPGNLTALACQVTSTWICSGIGQDLNDLRRGHQLLTSSLAKLTNAQQHSSMTSQLYNENVSTLEKLAILRAWAKVYICAIEQQKSNTVLINETFGFDGSLLRLVEPELETLVEYWFALLRDFAILSLPPSQFEEQLNDLVGTFFTPDSLEFCKDHYSSTWPLILLSCSIWMRQNEDEQCNSITPNQPINRMRAKETRLYLMLGICLDLMSNNRHYSADERQIQICLSSLKNLLICHWIQLELMRDVRMPIELLNVLYKIALTSDNMQTLKLTVELVSLLLKASQIKILVEAKKNDLDEQNGNQTIVSFEQDDDEEGEIGDNDEFTVGRKPFKGGEGADGVFEPKNSLVYAALEVLMCLLVRQIPQINLAQAKLRVVTPLHIRKTARFSKESDELMHSTLQLLAKLPSLCCTEGQIVLLPSLLNLLIGLLRECSRSSAASNNNAHNECSSLIISQQFQQSEAVNTANMVIRKICSECPDSVKFTKLFVAWESIMQSALLSLLNLAQDCQNTDPEQFPAVLYSSIVLLLSVSTANPTTQNLQLNSSPTMEPQRIISISEDLFRQFCKIMRNAIHSKSTQCQLKAIQGTRLLFQCQTISAPFIRELGNEIFSIIRPFVETNNENDKDSNDYTVENNRELKTEHDVHLIKECIQTIEAVLVTAKYERERLFVSLLVRSLNQFLDINAQNQPLRTDLHEFALARIHVIGTQHPDSFKALLQAAPEIRQRIEFATQQKIAQQKTQQQQYGKSSQNNTVGDQVRNVKAAMALPSSNQPSIKLATDFSNFAI